MTKSTRTVMFRKIEVRVPYEPDFDYQALGRTIIDAVKPQVTTDGPVTVVFYPEPEVLQVGCGGGACHDH